MVSLGDRQDLAALVESDPRLRQVHALIAGVDHGPVVGNGVSERLLTALIAQDKRAFREVGDEIGRRKIGAESDWCQDDFLLFLLLLGQQRWAVPLPFLDRMFEVRAKTTNPVPRKTNEVFASIARGEFGIDGDFGFLKVPFRRLLGGAAAKVGPDEAQKVLQAFERPGLFDQLTPFLKLLALAAHDQVLTERLPVPTETTTQLIEGIEKHAKDLSLRQWASIIAVLPGRVLIAVAVAVCAAVPILFGWGTALYRAGHAGEGALARPASVEVARAGALGAFPPEIIALQSFIGRAATNVGQPTILLDVEAMPWAAPTPAFAVEVSHADRPLRGAFAFTVDGKRNGTATTIIPIQRDGPRFRALLPPQTEGQALHLIVEVDADASNGADRLAKGIVLRPLQ